MDKSIELNGADAIGYIGMIEDVAGVKEFIEGDTRKGVLAAAEARISALSPESGSGVDNRKLEVAKCDTWRYHKTQPPRIFKKGTEIPTGWSIENAKLWARDAVGTWTKIGG